MSFPGDHLELSLSHEHDALQFLSSMHRDGVADDRIDILAHGLLSIAAAVRALQETVDDLRRMQP